MSKDLFDETTMTFGEHLEELRVHLWKAVVGLVLGVLVGLLVAKPIIQWINVPVENALEEYYMQREYALAAPETAQEVPQPEHHEVEIVYSVDALRKAGFVIDPPEGETEVTLAANLSRHAVEEIVEPMISSLRRQLFTMTPHEMFMVYLKVSLVGGIVLSSPWVLYQLWLFVAAGLYPHEKRYVRVFVPMSVALFLSGVFLCFFLVIPITLRYLFTFNAWLGVAPMVRISEWISFAVILPLMFGIAFELPLVMLFLERIGIFELDTYQNKRRIAILVIAVISMVLTPADPISMLCMLIPLVVLYEGGIVLVKMLRRHSPFEAQVPVP